MYYDGWLTVSFSSAQTDPSKSVSVVEAAHDLQQGTLLSNHACISAYGLLVSTSTFRCQSASVGSSASPFLDRIVTTACRRAQYAEGWLFYRNKKPRSVLVGTWLAVSSTSDSRTNRHTSMGRQRR